MRQLSLAAGIACLSILSPFPASAGIEEIRGSILFWAVDRNGDGIVDRPEADALAGLIFDAIDLNGDGRVTIEEAGSALVEAKPDLEAKAARRLAKRREDMVVRLNLAKPEGTPRDEYLDRSAQVFEAADGDGSGGLDAVEFVAVAKAFEPLLAY